MKLKGIYNDKSSIFQLIVFICTVFISGFLHIEIANFFVELFCESGSNLVSNHNLSSQKSINCLKFLQLSAAIGVFIFPVLFYSYLTGFNLQWNRIDRQSVILIITLMLSIIPFVSFLVECNSVIKFPHWLLQFDSNSEKLIDAFLQMPSASDLIFNIVVIAVIPAIGEELFFRGYLQQLLSERFANTHFGILITAFIFSFYHFDFQGLIPRFFLGSVLGYLFFLTRSIWIPILAHFINNAQAVIIMYLYPNSNEKLEKIGYSMSSETSVDLKIVCFSIFLVSMLLFLLYKKQNLIKDKK